MKKKFKVTVDGQTYNVELEEIAEDTSNTIAPVKPTVQTPVAKKTASKTISQAAAKTKAKPVVSAGKGEQIEAPLPGIVVEVNCTKGDRVNAGDVLLVLEAMKMQNDIEAPNAGTIIDIQVTEGDNVQPGDVLITLG